MKIRIADYIAKFICEKGIKDVFLLSGGGIMNLTDGLVCNKNLNLYCMHHEQAISMAIEAYGRLTNNMGVGYFTTGPGATNALTGLAGAWLDSSPCLFISGQAKRREAVYKQNVPGLRQVGVQEINILPIVESITKYAAFIDNPEDIRYHLEKAFYLAHKARPGPVWLDIPADVQGTVVETDNLRSFELGDNEREKPMLKKQDVENIVSWLKSSSRPVILIGQGVRIAGATADLLKLVEKHKIPVITTFLGIDVIENIHPEYVGRIGIKGTRAGNLAMQNADLLISIGTSLPVAEIGYEYDQFARNARKVVVDIDLSSHKKKTIKIDKLIEADAKDFIKNIYSALSADKASKKFLFKEWLDKCISWREKYPVNLPEYEHLKGKINIYHFVDHLSRKLAAGDVVVTDAGSAFYAGSQAVIIKKGIRYITSGGFATMGYSLPASIGLCAALGKKRIMCINGDGSFQQNIQELQTVVHYKLPLKIFILNNNGYLSIRFTQERYFENRLIGEGPMSGVSFPDAKKIADAYGIKFVRVSDNSKLDKVLDEVIGYEGPVICEIMTPEKQLIIPTCMSTKREDGSMVSKPLEDMYPFLDRDEFNKEMIIKPLDKKKQTI